MKLKKKKKNNLWDEYSSVPSQFVSEEHRSIGNPSIWKFDLVPGKLNKHVSPKKGGKFADLYDIKTGGLHLDVSQAVKLAFR